MKKLILIALFGTLLMSCSKEPIEFEFSNKTELEEHNTYKKLLSEAKDTFDDFVGYNTIVLNSSNIELKGYRYSNKKTYTFVFNNNHTLIGVKF